MASKKLLEEHVDALEKLLKLKQAIIDELEKKVAKLEMDKIYQPVQTPWYPQPTILSPFVTGTTTIKFDVCPATGGSHEYPQLWGGTNLPSCTKCGKTQDITNSTTITNGTGFVASANSITLANTVNE